MGSKCSSGDASMTEHSTLRAANIARQKLWDAGDQITAAYRGNELAGEVGEACNVIKKLERERMGIRGSRDTVEHLAEELSDIVICTDLIAMQYGIDLDAAVAAKFNATSEKVSLPVRLCPDPALATKDATIATMAEALDQCEDYFDNRADAEYFTDSPAPVPNEEMTLLAVVRAALESTR